MDQIKFIIRVGYTDYAMETAADAIAILEIASRMREVKQNGYSGPYYVQPDKGPWVDLLQMQKVIDQESEDEPDKFTKATREIPF